MELRGSKVQLATPHGHFFNGVANPEIVYTVNKLHDRWEPFLLNYKL